MKKMHVMLVGGGSGGHLTPLIAVAKALKEIRTTIEVGYIGQKGEKLSEVVEQGAIDSHYFIKAGKFRRYHGESVWSHLKDVRTLLLNVRDLFRVMMGTVQAWRLLRREHPDVIFLKGGFVCVPVGLAARMLRIAYVTHDSDAIPGLANRITGKQARYNTTALPAEYYQYPAEKVRHVGIPIQAQYKLVTDELKAQAKERLGYSPKSRLIVCTGGGNGSRIINEALAQAAAKVLDEHTYIVHIAGKSLVDETKALYEASITSNFNDHVKVLGFSNEFYELSAAADLVIARAGATTIAELAVQAKPAIVIPSPFLTGGQQLHNAELLRKAEAAVIVTEEELRTLSVQITRVLDNTGYQAELSRNIRTLAIEDASDHIAALLLELAEGTANNGVATTIEGS